MFETFLQYDTQIWQAVIETFIMVGVSILAAVLVGLPVGTVLFLCRRGGLVENPVVFTLVNFVVNVVRSFPFLLLVVVLIPFTRVIVGTAIGTTAATIPLAIIAIAHYSRLVEQSLLDVPRGVIEASVAMGASVPETVFHFLYKEARSSLVLGLTTSIVSFISYSTIMGVVGGGGIGDFAIRYGYQQFRTDLMLYMIAIMVILVQTVQFTGMTMARWLDKR